MKIQIIEGVVVSGRGKASKRGFENSEFLNDYFRQTPIKGTLNLCCKFPFELHKDTLIYTEGYDKFWPVLLNDQECIAFRYRNCPLHIVEIISPIHFRKKFNLLDGSQIRLEGNFSQPNFLKRYFWKKFWLKREELYYTDDYYTSKVVNNPLSKFAVHSK